MVALVISRIKSSLSSDILYVYPYFSQKRQDSVITQRLLWQSIVKSHDIVQHIQLVLPVTRYWIFFKQTKLDSANKMNGWTKWHIQDDILWAWKLYEHLHSHENFNFMAPCNFSGMKKLSIINCRHIKLIVNLFFPC